MSFSLHHTTVPCSRLNWFGLASKATLADNESTLDLVYQRLLAEFESLSVAHDSVSGMIEKCARVAKKFYNEIGEDDAADEEMADNNGSDDSGAEGEDNDETNEPDIDNGDATESVGGGHVAMGLIGATFAI